jgi:hypothetical protein
MASIAVSTALLFAGEVLGANAPPGPKIAATSCGGAAVPPSGNAFCSFESDGAGIVIGHHSCNIVGSCLVLGNGVRIGNGSCNGDTACSESGELDGSAVIGDNSCNGDLSCDGVGYQGRGVVGNKSCNGPAAPGPFGPEGVCTAVGAFGGNSRIGDSSCNEVRACFLAGVGTSGSFTTGNHSCSGSSACRFAGQNGGLAVIGNNSCNANRACFDNAQEAGSISRVGNGSCNELRSCQFAGDFGGHSDIGNSSCNASYACEFAGLFDPNAFSVIGNHSCNGSADLSDPASPVGICDSNLGTIDNNENNAP